MAEDGHEVMATALDGGASRYRADILKASSRVSVKWTVNAVGFQYLRAFFNSVVSRGSLPFLIDLTLDLPEFTEHTAHFIPGTFKTSRLAVGRAFVCTAQLEVTRIDDDDDLNSSFVLLANTFGLDDGLIEAGLLSLEHLVDVLMPDAMPG